MLVLTLTGIEVIHFNTVVKSSTPNMNGILKNMIKINLSWSYIKIVWNL